MSSEIKLGDPIFASNCFESLLWGDPAVSFDSVRQEYKAVIDSYLQKRSPSLWLNYPIEVARCAILGVNPINGKDLLNPDEFVASYQSNHPADHETVRQFYAGMKNMPAIQRQLSQQAAKLNSSS